MNAQLRKLNPRNKLHLMDMSACVCENYTHEMVMINHLQKLDPVKIFRWLYGSFGMIGSLIRGEPERAPNTSVTLEL